jgi:hypothetical protein
MNSQTHKMQNCAFVAADRVCKSIRNARNEQYDSHGYFIVYLQTNVQYFSSPTHYSPFCKEKNVFIFFLYFWLFSYYIMFKVFIPLPWRLNWGTIVLHWEQNSRQYCIRLARWKSMKGVIYRTEVYIMRHVCVKNKSESNTRLFVKMSNFQLQHEKNLSKKKPRRKTLLIHLSSA